MKFFILATIASIITSVAAHAADVDVTAQLIAKTIKDAGAISNANNELKIEVIKGKSEIEALKEEKLAITKIDFDRATGNFTAYISADNNIPFETAGTFHEIAKLPVLNRKLNKDEIISANDITYIELEPTKLRPEYVSDANMLIGKTSIHGILQARPIILSQLTAPKVMFKDKPMTLIYNNAALKIQTAGIALENGGIGQTIRVKNANSNRILVAKIINGNMAEVQSTDSVLASN